MSGSSGGREQSRLSSSTSPSLTSSVHKQQPEPVGSMDLSPQLPMEAAAGQSSSTAASSSSSPSASSSTAAAAAPAASSSASSAASGPIRVSKAARAIVVTPSGAVCPVINSAVTIGSKASCCTITVSGCADISARHLVIAYDASQQRITMQVFGRTGADIQGQHFFPSSLQHPLTASVPIVLPCSHPAHLHLYQFSLPAPSARSRASSALSLSQARREAEEMQLNRSDWSDAEQLRFQRALMSFGVHGLERVKRVAYMTKKNIPQLVNYCTAFLLECRKQLTDESELQYVDAVLETEGWRLQYAEPTLSRWRKLQSNASVWIKRLRTIQLLEDLLISARSQDVDVLSLLPKAALRLSAVSAPAPWWNNEHDRVLLDAVFELGYCLTGDHRVLTRRGWQSITRMQVGDEVLSFNVSTYAMEWKPVLAVESHAVDAGKAADTLYRMQGSGMDVIATRDHRMLLARRDPCTANGLALKEPVGYETVDELLRLTYAVSTLSPVSSFPHSQARAVVRAGFNTQPGVKVVITGLERVCDWWWQHDGQLGFLQFLGFWLRDGYLDAWNGVVGIKQKKEAGKQWLEQLLPRVFPRWWYSKVLLNAPVVAYIIRCPPLYAYLRLMAVGPLGYNPRDSQQLRSYPHFTKDEELAAMEQQSDYMEDNSSHRVSTWTEDDMLAAFAAAEDAADPERCCCCRRADWEDGNEMLLCSGDGCQRGGHLRCSGLTAVPDGDWLCLACSDVVEAGTEGLAEEDDAAPSSARRSSLSAAASPTRRPPSSSSSSSSSPLARRSSVSAATTESSTSQSASGERRFSFSGYSDHGEEKEGKESPASVQPMDTDAPALEEGDDGEQTPLAEAVEDRLLAQQLRAAGEIVWWNNGQWIIINRHWFYLKRWLGAQNVADVYSRLSREQAVALLDGFCRADGVWKSVRYDDNGEPTGQWRCSSSSFPLIDQLMLIGQLAGAAVDLHLHTKAGKTQAIAGRAVTFSVDHWELLFTFTRPARLPMLTAPLAQPVAVSDDMDGRGYYQHADDGQVYCIRVKDNTNFLTQRLANTRLNSGGVGVRAHSVFVGNCRYDDIKMDRRYRFLISRDWADRLKETAAAAPPQPDKPRPRQGRKARGGDDDDGGDDGEDEDEDDGKMDDVNVSTAEERERGSEAAEPAGGDLIDVNRNEFGIAFPASDQLTKRMRKLVENQRKLWWKRREGQEERDKPIRIRRKSRQQAVEAEGKADTVDAEAEARTATRAKREGEDENERVWGSTDVQQLVSAVLRHGIEKDSQHRIKWEKVAAECRKGEDWLPSLERVFLHCLEDHYMQMHSAPLPAVPLFGLPAVTPRYLISPADGELLTSRLLFFSRLRSRLLVLSPYTLQSLLDTHRPPPQQQPPLPAWYEAAAHDLCLLQGVGRWGLDCWQEMVQDESLRWRRRLSELNEAAAARDGFSVLGKRAAEAQQPRGEVEDAADKEVQAIQARVKEEERELQVKNEDAAERKVKTESSQPLTVSAAQAAGLLHRVQELVAAVYPMAGAAAPLSCTFSALCPLMPAESSAARRKREASKEAALEAVTTSRRGKRSRRVRQDVSIHSMPDGELSHSFKHFVPSLTRYQRYLFTSNLPLTHSVSAFDVTPLSITAVSTSHPVWKPLVRHVKAASSPFTASSPLYLCGDRRDEHKLLAPQRNLYRINLSASTQQPVFPLWLRGGLTLYDPGRLDGRCQFVDDRPDSGGGGGVYVAGVGYRAVRVHQSFVDPNRMARYLCEIVDAERQSRGSGARDQQLVFGPTVLSAPQLLTEAAPTSSSSSSAASDTAASAPALPRLTASDHHRDRPVLFRLSCSDCPGSPLISRSPQSLWSAVADLIYDRSDCPVGSRRYGCNGWERFGLTHPVVRWCMERQQGIDLCVAYCRQPPMTMQRYSV